LAPPDNQATDHCRNLTTGYPGGVWRGTPIRHLPDAPWHRRKALLAILAADCTAAAERHRQILASRRLHTPDDSPEVIAARLAVWGLTHPDAEPEARREYVRLKVRRLRAQWRTESDRGHVA
jgi:hypothetical protein